MLHRVTQTAMVVGALLLPIANAHAQFLSGNNINGCGGDAFISCAQWSASAKGDSLVLTVTNTSGLAPANNPNSTFTIIGLGNVSASDPTSFKYSGYGTWNFDATVNGFNGFQLSSNNFGGNAHGGNPATNGLLQGHSVTFTFFWNSAVQASNFANTQLAFMDQGAVSGCGNSSKMVLNGNTGAAEPGNTTTTSCAPPGTVPEPSSVMLLGSALVGLAGTGVIRRRPRA